MIGHHDVKVFVFKGGSDDTHTLPEGWKPFAAEMDEGVMWVYARKWVRDSHSTEESLATSQAMQEVLERTATHAR